MAHRKSSRLEDDPVLRRARRILVSAEREAGAVDSLNSPKSAGRRALATPLTADRRRRIIGLIADLQLSLDALIKGRDHLAQEVGMALQRKQAVSAYHRTNLLLRKGRRDQSTK
jgi:hypothetical protein